VSKIYVKPIKPILYSKNFIWMKYKGEIMRMNKVTTTKKSDRGMIVLPPRISHILVEATNEPRVDRALDIVIKDFLERRLEEAIKKIEAFEEKWDMIFEEFKKRCGHDELPDKCDPYSWEVEEDFREWEAAETLKEHYTRMLDRYTP
jgi:hypothetical protein